MSDPHPMNSMSCETEHDLLALSNFSSTSDRTSYFVLADCNNFYASCERLFVPKLLHQPIAVLSNNDGCVVARSQEAKNLGIKMGIPYFMIKDLCNIHNVFVCSSNYLLYGDLSARVMQVLEQELADIEVYSIDEAFLHYSNVPDELYAVSRCVELRKKMSKWVGIPVSFGIAPTKTLAKIANALAKKNPEVGVYDLRSLDIRRNVLQLYPIGDVWGIGLQLTTLLKSLQVYSAWDFTQMDSAFVRKKMGVVGFRTQLELQGQSCIAVEEVKARKNIMKSRSFGKSVTKKEELAEALATYISSACEKMRSQQTKAQAICVFLVFYIDKATNTRDHRSSTESFSFATSYTPHVITTAKKMLDKIYVADRRYKKCGIILLDLIPETQVMTDLFEDSLNPKREAAMKVMDRLNAGSSKAKIFFGAAGIDKQWQMRCEKRSDYNTRQWDHLPIAKT